MNKYEDEPTGKPTRELFAEWAGKMFGKTEQSDNPTEEASEPENKPSPMGSTENSAPIPTRDIFAMTAREAIQNRI